MLFILNLFNKPEKAISILCILFSFNLKIIAQPYTCPSDVIFLHTTSGPACTGCPLPTPIKVFNPLLPLSATNPTNSNIFPPTGSNGGGGLAFGTNIFASNPNPTFYTNPNGSTINWWNGTTWVNTGHNFPSINFGFGGGLIFGITGTPNNYGIWKYDGTGNATQLLTVTTSSFLCGDVVVDCNGDFYLLSILPAVLYKYNSSGTLQNTYPINGLPNSVSGSGAMAIVNGQIYINYSPPFATTGDVYVGSLNGSSINFIKSICQSPLLYGDFADCSECDPLNLNPGPSIGPVTASNNGPLACGTPTANASVTSSIANMSYFWSGPLISGPNTGSVITVNAPGIYTCVATTSLCPTQTFVVTTTVVASGNITAGLTSSNILNCTNLNSTLTASPSSTNLSYSWAGPGITSSMNDIAIVNQVGTYTVSISSLTNNCVGIATIAVTSNTTLPVITITNSGSMVCANTTITLSANGAQSYTWSTGQTANTVQFNATTPTVITVAGTDALSNCTSSSSISISVISVPVPIVSDTAKVCDGDSFTLNASAPQSSPNFYWSGPNGFNSTQAYNTINNSTSAMSGIYTVTATYLQGNITCQSSNTVLVNVKPHLSLNLANEIKACINQSLTVFGPGGASTYSWYFNNQLVSSNQDLFINSFSSLNAGNYSLEIDFNGCKSRDSVKLSYYPLPVLTTVLANTTICVNESHSFTLGINGGSGNFSYLINPSQNVSVINNSIQISYITASTVYSVVISDNACPNYSVIETFSVDVINPPYPVFAFDVNRKCEPLCLNLNSHLQPNEFIQYNFNNTIIVNEDNKTICLEAGAYNLTVTTIGQNGCKAEFSNYGLLEVYPKPIADFSYSSSTPVYEEDDNILFMDASHNASISTWHWYFNSNTQWTSSQQNPSFTYPEPGNYLVTLLVTSDKGCKDTVSKTLTVEDNYAIYIPNTFTPDMDNLNDIFIPKGHGIKKYEMMIFNRWGEKLFQTKSIDQGWDGTYHGSECKVDTYVWKINLITINGKGKELTGNINLIR